MNELKLHRILIFVGIGFLPLFAVYMIIADASGYPDPMIAWGLPVVSLLFITAGVAVATFNNSAIKPGPTSGAHQFGKEQAAIAASVIVMTVGTIIALIVNVPDVMGYALGLGFFFGFLSWYWSPKKTKPTQYGSVTNPRTVQTAPWFRGLRILILLIPVFYAIIMLLAIWSWGGNPGSR